MRVLVCSLCLVAGLAAGEPPRRAEVLALIDRAQAWLTTRSQPDGALAEGGVFVPGITALAAGALIEEPHALTPTHPAVASAIRYLVALKQPDGSVCVPDEGIGNYTTAVALRFAAALPDARAAGFDVVAMQKYIFGLQNTDAASLGAGGIGYSTGKPAGSEDLSNTAYAVEALHASGVPASDPRMQAALAFMQRCQDLRTVNDAEWIVGTGSGGGVYGPQDAARSWEARATGTLPRYAPTGSMTYALISSYLLLDLRRDDPRVQAAVDWVMGNYGFAANPGMGAGREQQGLFHSNALAARALDLLDPATLHLPDGSSADWRADLYAALAKRAMDAPLPDGSLGAMWVNTEQRWGEGLPHLCTAYAIRALKAVARHLTD